MIIVPTEKRFDWKHAPLMLLAIVIVNLFVYFIVQTDDDEIIENAYNSYYEANLLEIEWPLLKTYLKETEQDSRLEEFEELYDSEWKDAIIGGVIYDHQFFRYLNNKHYDYLQDNYVGKNDWLSIREQIDERVQSTVIIGYGLTPSNLKWYSVLTHQFLHGSVMHILGNLFILILCGFAVEAAIGHWRFLAFYLVSGIAGGLLHAVFNLDSVGPLVGASGAISGAMAMYLGVFRLKKIEFFYWLFVFVGYFRAPALLILVFYIGKEALQLFFYSDSNVAFLAHIGGFIAGAALIVISYKLNPNIINEEYVEEDQSIDPRQEKKATIYEFLGRYQFEAAEKALTRIIESDGLDFELAFIRYNIEKIDKDAKEKKATFIKHLIQLLTTRNPSELEANQLELVWKENVHYLEELDNNTLIKIAMSLVKASSPDHAAELFDHTYNNIQQKNPELAKKYHTPLAVLAKKLADAYGDNHAQRAHKYSSLQNELMAGIK